jgi:peptidoglycan hydrolase-like protein with peptidoglycan-binding domain
MWLKRQELRDESFFGDWRSRNASATRTGAPDAPGLPRVPRHRRKAVAAIAAAGVIASVTVPLVSASADPSAHTWWRLRQCESSNRYDINTGNGHYGAYQFDLSTWRSVGGHGYPNQASKGVQDARALILYRERGWQPWQCAGILGLRPDADAGSGRVADIHVPIGRSHRQRPPVPKRTPTHHRTHHRTHRPTNTPRRTSPGRIPAFPGGSHWYYYGQWNSHIKAWQDEMHRRGYFPVGTGQFGPHTLQVVKQIQRLNGLVPNGYLGPNTWRLAWVGRYVPPGTGRTPRVPAFPGGSTWYHYGDWNKHVKAWQDEMHRRGYFPVGTGQFGPHTLQVVKQIQRLNGLVPNGYLGPNTWRLAWVGRYRNP